MFRITEPVVVDVKSHDSEDHISKCNTFYLCSV